MRRARAAVMWEALLPSAATAHARAGGHGVPLMLHMLLLHHVQLQRLLLEQALRALRVERTRGAGHGGSTGSRTDHSGVRRCRQGRVTGRALLLLLLLGREAQQARRAAAGGGRRHLQQRLRDGGRDGEGVQHPAVADARTRSHAASKASFNTATALLLLLLQRQLSIVLLRPTKTAAAAAVAPTAHDAHGVRRHGSPRPEAQHARRIGRCAHAGGTVVAGGQADLQGAGQQAATGGRGGGTVEQPAATAVVLL